MIPKWLNLQRESIEKRAAEDVAYAESLGFHAIAQFYAMFPATRDDGREVPMHMPFPFRYSWQRVVKDYEPWPVGMALAFVVRYCDPNDPAELTAHAERLQAREQESREGAK